jgi:acyl carrier protein
MNHITIVVEAERRFGIKVRTAEIERLRNVGDFMTLIAAKRG